MQFISPAGHGKNVSSSHPPPEFVQAQGIQTGPQSHLMLKAHWRIQRFPQRVHMCYMCFCSKRIFMFLMFNKYIFHRNVLCSSCYSYFLSSKSLIHTLFLFSSARIESPNALFEGHFYYIYKHSIEVILSKLNLKSITPNVCFGSCLRLTSRIILSRIILQLHIILYLKLMSLSSEVP